jgi:hypothetical protein
MYVCVYVCVYVKYIYMSMRTGTNACLHNCMHATMSEYIVQTKAVERTSFITGTGFIKCMPMTLSGRLVAAPNLVMEIEPERAQKGKERLTIADQSVHESTAVATRAALVVAVLENLKNKRTGVGGQNAAGWGDG